MNHEFPRRMRVDLMKPAELAIRNAVIEIEKMAPDVRLTNAQILLGQAKDLVSNFIDNVPSETPTLAEENNRLREALEKIIEHWNDPRPWNEPVAKVMFNIAHKALK